ncbi:MAG: glycoside hydrolase family 2, partial [Spirochaetales bacterium]|nr:glycoside hydrolase family 2 [Candidatus Physcosoma equi]
MIPHSYYPRPQMQRENWECLNGYWHGEVRNPEGALLKEGEILVPFSPEAPLSGFNHILQPQETFRYERHISYSGDFDQEKELLLLHFGASDYETEVYVDGVLMMVHKGGYLPFTLSLTKPHFRLALMVRDPSDTEEQQRGKQKLQRGGIWYTPQSGLWQSVWMEKVPKNYIQDLTIVPSLEDVTITVQTPEKTEGTIHLEGKNYPFVSGIARTIEIENPHLWSPEDPYLYSFSVETKEDRVQSYFGLRTFGVGEDKKGNKRLLLNGKPYFHHGLLDQGYYKGGLYTPKDEEEMVSDLLLVKSMGFNCLRKHIKIEPLRWYYHCDRLGILVWQDMVNGGGHYSLPVISGPLFVGSFLKDSHYGLFKRKDKEKRDEFEENVRETVDHLKNVTSLGMWVTFNEGWGQFDSVRISEAIHRQDPTRTIDMHSGWHDQGKGDFKSLHVYFRPYRHRKDKKGRCVILTEFGGYGYAVPGHTNTDKVFQYKGYQSKEELTDAVVAMYQRDILSARKEGLSASIYTQVSDVEDELNGLVTYDRKVEKMDKDKILALSKA